MYLYEVFDKVAEQFAPPFVANTDAQACRIFNDMLHGKDITYADDLVLYRCADFNAQIGEVTKFYPPVSLAQAYEDSCK